MEGSKSTLKGSSPGGGEPPELGLVLDKGVVPRFAQLLQSGVQVERRVGCTVLDFLCDELGLTPEYVTERIQTLFLDGKPVDDVERAVVLDGATLALSAAMPGLAGATLRRGGIFSGMRSQISYRTQQQIHCRGKGTVRVKVFNLLAGALAPNLLGRGVWIEGPILNSFLSRQARDFWERCRRATLNGEALGVDEISEIRWPPSLVFLQISFQD